AVLLVGATGHQRLLGLFQCSLPLLRARPRSQPAVSVNEAPDKQAPQTGMQDFERWSERVRAIGIAGASPVGKEREARRPMREAARRDARGQGRWVLTPRNDTGKRVRPLHQELEDQDGQSKG